MGLPEAVGHLKRSPTQIVQSLEAVVALQQRVTSSVRQMEELQLQERKGLQEALRPQMLQSLREMCSHSVYLVPKSFQGFQSESMW